MHVCLHAHVCVHIEGVEQNEWDTASRSLSQLIRPSSPMCGQVAPGTRMDEATVAGLMASRVQEMAEQQKEKLNEGKLSKEQARVEASPALSSSSS